MASNLSLAVKLTLSSAEFKAALQSSNAEVRAFAQKMGTQLRSVEPQLKGLSSGFGEIGSAMRSAIAVVGGALGAGSFLQTLQAIQNTETRLRALSGSTQEYARTQAFLTELSAAHHKSQLDLAQSYARLQALEQAGTVTREQAEKILTGLSNAQSATGATAEQLGQVMFGLAQGLSAVTLRAEDLNQVTEPMPGLLQRLDQASGQAAGGFRRMVNEGQVTSEMFATTLVAALATYEGAAESTSGTVTAKFADIQAAYQRLVEALSGDINSPLVGLLNTVASALERMNRAAEFWEKQGGFLNGITGGVFRGTGPDAFSEDQQLKIMKHDLAERLKFLDKEQPALPLSITVPNKSSPPKYDKTKAAAIADYLESRGLRPLQVAAVVGNLAQEAPGGAGNFGTALSGDQGSVGLAQWRLERKDELLKFAASQSAAPTDIKVQLDFLVAEAKRRGDLDAINAARTPEEAAAIFMRRFERPNEAAANLDYRQAVAADVFAQSSIDRLRLAARAKTDQPGAAGETGTRDEETRLAEELTRIEEQRTEVIVKEREELRRKGIETYEQMVSDLQQAVDEERQIVGARAEYERQINAQAEADFTRSQSAQREFLRSAFDEKLISARDYYAALQKLADTDLQHTQQRIDAEIALEKTRLDEINKTIEALAARSQSTTDLQVQQIQSLTRIESLSAQKTTADEQFRSTSREITVDATAAQAATGIEKNPITAWADQFNAKLGDMSSFAFTAANGMQNAFASFFESGMQGTESLGEAFARMARRIAAEITALMVTKAIISFIGMLGQGFGGLFSSGIDFTGLSPTSSDLGGGLPGEAFPGAGLGKSAGGFIDDPERRAMTAINGDVQKLIDSSQIQVIRGPGTGTSDSIAAELPVGSYILRERAMRALHFAEGGPVDGGAGLVSTPGVRAIDSDVQKLIEASPIQVIRGPGTGTSDSIAAELPVGSYILRERAMRELRYAEGGTVRARVSAGEGFVPPSAVRAIGVEALDRINSLGAGMRAYATGGLVDGALSSSQVVEGDTITVNMPLTVNGMQGGQTDRDAGVKAQALKRELRDAVDARVVELQRPGGLLWSARGRV